MSSEYSVIQSYFKIFTNGPVVNVAINVFSITIDRVAFIQCISAADGGAIYLHASENAGVIISRTCASECKAGNNLHGNFGRIELGTYGSCELYMVSVDKCEKENKITYHSIYIINGNQALHNINNTNCKCFRNSGITNLYSTNISLKYCNFVDNVMQETLLLMTSYNVLYKYFNIIGNICSSSPSSSSYLGLIYNYGSNSRLSIEESYIFGNTCKWFIQNDGKTSISGCFMDYKVSTGNSVSFYEEEENIGKNEMTLFASCGLHADLPYKFFSPSTHKGCVLRLVQTMANAVLSKNVSYKQNIIS